MTEAITSIFTTTPNQDVSVQRQPEATAQRHLNECRDLLLKHFAQALPSLLDQVDDALFQLAEKADHDNTQKLYFDAMREVRIKRPGIQNSFKEYLIAGFESSYQTQASGAKVMRGLELTAQKLTLVDDDVLEESLAVTNMANRITGLCKEELFALDMRIGWLLDDTALEAHDNPLSPQTICESFDRACADIEAATEIRLIILKLFDKYMVMTMQGVYQALNQYLVRNDILPYIPTTIKKQPHVIRQPGSGFASMPAAMDDALASPVSIDQQVFNGFPGTAGTTSGPGLSAGEQALGSALIDTGLPQIEPPLPLQLSQELLSTLQQVMRVNGPATPVGAAAQWTAPAPQVLGQLTALQTNPNSGVCVTESVSGSTGGASVLRELRQTGLGTDLNHSDDLMIDVVAMMFDYIFDDPNIPAEMKVLIGRLQIPLLKVAMLDKTFFSRRFHPARKLLNTLAEAAVGWRQEQDGNDELYPRMERAVQRVLDEFDIKIEVIGAILAEFEASLEDDARQAEENAWWSAKVIQGREKLASARTKIAELICERTSAIGYPFLSNFVSEHWRNLLLTAFVKEGEDSCYWQNTLRTLDDLIWSVLPIAEEQERLRLSMMLPDLLSRLKQGMSDIGLAKEEAHDLLAKLARIHLAQVRGVARPAEGELDATQGDVLPPVVPLHSSADNPNPNANTNAVNIGLSRKSPTHCTDQQHLKTALERANQRIYERAQSQPECAGMGTTFVAVWFRNARVIVAHAGDSRLYRLRDGHLQQITLDHSLRQQMVSNGFYTMAEAKQAIASNLVTRALGVDPEVEIEIHDHEVCDGDVYLLCSDGLSDLVEDAWIEKVLITPAIVLETAAQSLLALANDNGGTDNISVSLVRVWNDASTQIQDDNYLELFSSTDVGRCRAHNEDAQGDMIAAGLVLLADGMGGYNAGEVASRLAVDSVIECMGVELLPTADEDIPHAVTNEVDSDINYTALNALFDNAGINATRTPGDFPEIEPEIELDATIERPWMEEECLGCEEIILESVGGIEHGADDEDFHARQVTDLEVGVWVEFRNDNEAATRARLTWISESTGNYLFTDRHGHKVVDATPAGLALQFRRGTARRIEDMPLFERAVNHLMARLHCAAD